MLKEKLLEIEETESQAAAIVAKAQIQVEQIIHDTAKRRTVSEERVQRRGVEIMVSAVDEAKPEVNALLGQIEKTAAEDEVVLRTMSQPKVGTAAQALVDRLLGSGGG